MREGGRQGIPGRGSSSAKPKRPPPLREDQGAAGMWGECGEASQLQGCLTSCPITALLTLPLPSDLRTEAALWGAQPCSRLNEV